MQSKTGMILEKTYTPVHGMYYITSEKRWTF